MYNGKITWSKLLLLMLFINFFILEIFIGGITIYTMSIALAIGTMPDFAPLLALIGAVIGQTLSYGIYIAKAKAENTEHGIIYETTMRQLDEELNNSIEEDYN